MEEGKLNEDRRETCPFETCTTRRRCEYPYTFCFEQFRCNKQMFVDRVGTKETIKKKGGKEP